MKRSVSVLSMLVVLVACQNAAGVEIVSREELGAERIELECSKSALDAKRDEYIEERGAPEDYHVVFAFGPRSQEEDHTVLMSNRALHERLQGEGEAMAFVPRDLSTVTIARFEGGLDMDSFLEASSSCSRTLGENCNPILYHDGERAYCLLLTEDDLER